MKKKILAGLFLAGLMVFMVVSPTFAAKKVKPITIKCSHAFGPKINFIDLWVKWADDVVEKTEGRVKFKWYHGGALSKPKEEQEHCRRGLVQMVGTSATWYSHMPLWEMNGALPFQPSDTLTSVKTKWQLYQEFPELRNEVEHMNMKLMIIAPYGDYHIISRRPLKSLKDFSKLKVAVLGRQQTKWFDGTNATPIFLPGPARYEALEKGVVDASLMGGLAISMLFRHPEVAKNVLIANLGQYCSFFFAINQDTWNKISAKDQKTIETLNKIYMFEKFPERIEGDEQKYRKIMEEKHGVTFYKLSEADKRQWAKSIPNLAKSWVDEAKNGSEKKLRKRIWARYLELTAEAGHEWPMDWSNVN